MKAGQALHFLCSKNLTNLDCPNLRHCKVVQIFFDRFGSVFHSLGKVVGPTFEEAACSKIWGKPRAQTLGAPLPNFWAGVVPKSWERCVPQVWGATVPQHLGGGVPKSLAGRAQILETVLPKRDPYRKSAASPKS